MADSSISCIGDKLVVGQIDSSIGNVVQQLVPGTAVINGPCYIGMTASPGISRASCMIGPSLSGLPVSLETIGITNIFGNLNVFAISTITGLTNKFGITLRQALSLCNGISLKNSLDLCNGPVTINSPLVVAGPITTPLLEAAKIGTPVTPVTSIETLLLHAYDIGTPTLPVVSIFSELISADIIESKFPKYFNIPHPSKPGYRLIHACIEGPENGVYFRGHLKDKDFIELPSFWNNLIDPESITVHFTPHKLYQELYVKSIEWGKVIKIVNNLGGPIDCDYVVYAERKDVEKLVVERKGDTM